MAKKKRGNVSNLTKFNRLVTKKKNLLAERKIERLKRQIEQIKKLNKYRKTGAGRISEGISKVFSNVRGKISKNLYRNSYGDTGYNEYEVVRRKRGRPKGSYDPRYAQFGGVYGYRRWLRTQLRIQKILARREAMLTPKERAILEQIRMQQLRRAENPESKVFPDTTGRVSFRGYMDEINRAANEIR